MIGFDSLIFPVLRCLLPFLLLLLHALAAQVVAVTLLALEPGTHYLLNAAPAACDGGVMIVGLQTPCKRLRIVCMCARRRRLRSRSYKHTRQCAYAHPTTHTRLQHHTLSHTFMLARSRHTITGQGGDVRTVCGLDHYMGRIMPDLAFTGFT